MSSTRASMQQALADILSKPSTPGRAAAIANISAALERMSEFAAKAPRGGGRARAMTIHDREVLMLIADDRSRSQAERDRAAEILDAGGELSRGDVEFLDRATGSAKEAR